MSGGFEKCELVFVRLLVWFLMRFMYDSMLLDVVAQHERSWGLDSRVSLAFLGYAPYGKP